MEAAVESPRNHNAAGERPSIESRTSLRRWSTSEVVRDAAVAAPVADAGAGCRSTVGGGRSRRGDNAVGRARRRQQNDDDDGARVDRRQQEQQHQATTRGLRPRQV